jgi:hypothetical protein
VLIDNLLFPEGLVDACQVSAMLGRQDFLYISANAIERFR